MMLDEPLLLVHAVLVMFICCHLQVADGASLKGSTVCEDTDRGWPQYYDKTDNQCHKCIRCEKGFGLSERCGSGVGKNAFCDPCPTNEFSQTASASVCEPCRVCDNTMDDTIPCTTKNDRQCGPCILGYFRHQPRDDHCVSCQDEQSSHKIPDCQRTPEPVIHVSKEQGSSTEKSITTSEPPNSSPILTIVVVTILAVIVLVVIGAVVISCRKKFSLLSCQSRSHRYASDHHKKNGRPNESEQRRQTSKLLSPDNNSQPTDTTVTSVELVHIATCDPERQLDKERNNLVKAVPIDRTKDTQEAKTNGNPNGSITRWRSPSSQPATGEQRDSTASSRTGSSFQDTSDTEQTRANNSLSSDAAASLVVLGPDSERESNAERIIVPPLAITIHVGLHPLQTGDVSNVNCIDNVQNKKTEGASVNQLSRPLAQEQNNNDLPKSDFPCLVRSVMRSLWTSGLSNLVSSVLERRKEIRQATSPEGILYAAHYRPAKTGGDPSAASSPGAQNVCDDDDAENERVTQGEEPTNPTSSEDQTQFKTIFQRALALTKDTLISEMDYQDTRLLDKMLHERTKLLADSLKFHYVKLGELFNIPKEDLRKINSATEVLNRIPATHKGEPTIEELLKKLNDTKECYDVVRELAKQIVKRGSQHVQK